MSHAEEIKTSLYLADSCLNGEEGGVINNLKSVLSHLSDIAPVFAKANELSDRLDNCYIEVKDIADDISASVDDIDFDPRQLQNINDRLDVLYSLEHKYHVDSVEALIQHLNTVAERIENIDTGEKKLKNKNSWLNSDEPTVKNWLLNCRPNVMRQRWLLRKVWPSAWCR